MSMNEGRDYMQVILYSTGCPKCEVMKEKLKDSGIPYTESDDVSVLIKNHIDTVPVLSVDGVLMEFSQANDWLKNRGV